jgi:hypothetical protein
MFLAVTLALSACATHTDPSAVHRNVERDAAAPAPENQRAARDHVPPCFPRDRIKNEDTPLALNLYMWACAERGEFEQALFTYALGGVYGNYDALRVADPSSHDAAQIVRFLALKGLDDERHDQFVAYVRGTLSDKIKRQKTCDAVRGIGPPSYFPQYMVDHGLAAMHVHAEKGSLPNRGLVTNFNEKQAWDAALNSYLQCDTAR